MIQRHAADDEIVSFDKDRRCTDEPHLTGSLRAQRDGLFPAAFSFEMNNLILPIPVGHDQHVTRLGLTSEPLNILRGGDVELLCASPHQREKRCKTDHPINSHAHARSSVQTYVKTR